MGPEWFIFVRKDSVGWHVNYQKSGFNIGARWMDMTREERDNCFFVFPDRFGNFREKFLEEARKHNLPEEEVKKLLKQVR